MTPTGTLRVIAASAQICYLTEVIAQTILASCNLTLVHIDVQSVFTHDATAMSRRAITTSSSALYYRDNAVSSDSITCLSRTLISMSDYLSSHNSHQPHVCMPPSMTITKFCSSSISTAVAVLLKASFCESNDR